MARVITVEESESSAEQRATSVLTRASGEKVYYDKRGKVIGTTTTSGEFKGSSGKFLKVQTGGSSTTVPVRETEEGLQIEKTTKEKAEKVVESYKKEADIDSKQSHFYLSNLPVSEGTYKKYLEGVRAEPSQIDKDYPTPFYLGTERGLSAVSIVTATDIEGRRYSKPEPTTFKEKLIVDYQQAEFYVGEKLRKQFPSVWGKSHFIEVDNMKLPYQQKEFEKGSIYEFEKKTQRVQDLYGEETFKGKGISTVAGIYGGGARMFRTQPLRIGTTVGLGIATFGVGSALAGASASGSALATVGLKGFQTVGAVSFGAYGVTKGYQIYETPTYYAKGMVLGEVGVELTAFGVGYKSPKSFEYISTPFYKGVGIKFGKSGKSIIGASEGKIKIGTPKVNLKPYEKDIFGKVPKTATERAIYKKSLKSIYPEAELQKFKYYETIEKATAYKKGKLYQKQLTRDVEFLTTKQADVVVKWGKQHKAIVEQYYGSEVIEPYVPKEIWTKYRGNIRPKDFDIQLKKGYPASEKAVQQLVKDLNKVKGGFQVRQSPSRPTLIESKVKGEWKHGVDIHTTEDVYGYLATQDSAWGFSMKQGTKRIEGLPTMKISESGVRKGASIMTPRKEGFAPESHRAKDIRDYFMVKEALAQQKMFGQDKLTSSLKQLKELYPKDVFEIKTPAKRVVYSPTQRAYSLPSPASFLGVSSSFGLRASKSLSTAISKSISASISPSKSPSLSPSPYLSKSPYPYPSMSPSLSPSLSPSKSPSPSPSPSMSPSLSPSPYPSITKIPTKTIITPFKLKGYKRKKEKPLYFTEWSPKLTPSLTAQFFGITAPKYPKLITGIEVRPIIRTRRRKKNVKR